jgi:hypothetical protein
VRVKGGGEGKGEEMTQTLYAHMNKRKKRVNEGVHLYSNKTSFAKVDSRSYLALST